MRGRTLIYVLMAVLLAALIFWWGRRQGREQGKVALTNNVAIVKEIAELAALNVTGSSTIKVSNRAPDNTVFGQLRNAFTENTLNVTIPYEAKFGVQMQQQDVRINTSQKTVTIYLPAVEMLSMQLKLDNVDAITRTGILSTTTVDQYVKVQQKLYSETEKSLRQNPQYAAMAREHITQILRRYYAPLGYEVNVVFGGAAAPPLD